MIKGILYSTYLLQEIGENTPNLEDIFVINLSNSIYYLKNRYSKFLQVVNDYGKDFGVDNMVIGLLLEYYIYYYDTKDTSSSLLLIIDNVVDELSEFIIDNKLYGFIISNLKIILQDNEFTNTINNKLLVVNSNNRIFLLPVKWIDNKLLIAGYRRG